MAVGAIFMALLMYRKHSLALFSAIVLLALFFIAPGNAYVPLWALWDKYLAILLIIPAMIFVKRTFKPEINLRYLFPTVLLVSFVGLEVDAMFGNLLFGLYSYSLLGMTAKAVGDLYIPFALAAFWERLIVAFISALVTVPLVIAVDKNPRIRWLIHRE